MSFQICINTNKSLHQLANEIRDLLALPPFQETSFSGETYCQFEMLGLLVLIHQTDDEDCDPEVRRFPYCFDIQTSFTEHELDTDNMEYGLQPYYAQFLAFRLGVETAYREKQKSAHGWQIRYRFFKKNYQWNNTILFGEPGWEPAVLEMAPGSWRNIHLVF